MHISYKQSLKAGKHQCSHLYATVLDGNNIITLINTS